MREKELQVSKAMEGHYLAELHALRGQAEERAKATERLTPNRAGNAHIALTLQLGKNNIMCMRGVSV